MLIDKIDTNGLETDTQDTGLVVDVSGLIDLSSISGIPTVSEWGLIVLTLLGLTFGTVMLARRRSQVAGTA